MGHPRPESGPAGVWQGGHHLADRGQGGVRDQGVHETARRPGKAYLIGIYGVNRPSVQLDPVPAGHRLPQLTPLDEERHDGQPVRVRELDHLSRTAGSPGQVVELTYSDGLAVVSLFVQRGELGQPMPGWHRIKLHGRTVYAVDPDEMCFAWSAGGFVYTLVADAPLATVSQVVAALPDTG